MKLLRVISSMQPSSGGPCQGIRNAHDEMEKLGVEEEVVCLDSPDTRYLQSEKICVHALGSGRGPLAYNSSLLPWLEENIPRFDAVILHGLWQWPCIAAWIAIKRLQEKNRRSCLSAESPTVKVPRYFVMPHGMLDPWFQRDRSRRLKAIRNWIFWKVIQHRVIRDAESLLFTCQEELLLARETFRPYQPKCEVNVGYGVPEPPARSCEMDKAFRESCSHLPQQQPFLLFLSRIHPKKGVDLLIKAYAEVFGQKNVNTSQELPALVVAGPLDSEYAQSMVRLAQSLLPRAVFTPSEQGNQFVDSKREASQPSIHFTGMLQADAKWGAFYGCDAFILPSHQENFGIAVVEALACDKPVLISKSVNIWSEVIENNAGLVDNDNLEGVKNLLIQWKNSTRSLEPRRTYLNLYIIKEFANKIINIMQTSK
jgi:glycosyltransferase involved in cell wall biosynthesis